MPANFFYCLEDTKNAGSLETLHDFFNMVVGCLIGSTPHMVSATITGITRLMYEFSELCLSVPNLFPYAFMFFESNNREVIKATLGLKIVVYQLSSIIEEKEIPEDKSTKIEIKKLANDEEHMHLKGKIGELERVLDLVNEGLESSRAMTVEKRCQSSDLLYQLSHLSDVKRSLHDKDNSLRTESHKCTMSLEQILQCSDKIRELENALELVNKGLETKDMQLQ